MGSGTLWADSFRMNPVAGIVATRRLFRIFWAYWLAFAVLGMLLAFHGLMWPVIATVGILTLFSGSFRQFSGAAWVSAPAPPAAAADPAVHQRILAMNFRVESNIGVGKPINFLILSSSWFLCSYFFTIPMTSGIYLS